MTAIIVTILAFMAMSLIIMIFISILPRSVSNLKIIVTFFLLILVNLYFCFKVYHYEKGREIVLTTTETKTYRLLSVKPPKNMYVDLLDMKSLNAYTNIHVSTYCHGYERNFIGDEYDIEVSYVTRRNGVKGILFNNLKSKFCRG